MVLRMAQSEGISGEKFEGGWTDWGEAMEIVNEELVAEVDPHGRVECSADEVGHNNLSEDWGCVFQEI